MELLEQEEKTKEFLLAKVLPVTPYLRFFSHKSKRPRDQETPPLASCKLRSYKIGVCTIIHARVKGMPASTNRLTRRRLF